MNSPDGMARRRRVAGRLLGVVSVFVPSDARAEWLREWQSEIWYEVERGGSARRLAGRLAGALPHALWLRATWFGEGGGWRDIRHGLRGMRRQPGFAALVVGTMGLGIGVTVAMFTIVNAVLIRPLPYPGADDLVFMFGSFAQYDAAFISPPDFLDYREGTRTFESLAGRTLGNGRTVLSEGEPENVRSAAVTANFFATLGVAPMLGRAFLPDEEFGEPSAVIVSNALWNRRFGSDPAVVGRDIRVNGRMLRVVGVMPPLLDRTLDADLWLPMAFGTPSTSVRRFHFMRAIGRLASGMTLEQAQTDMDRIAVDLERTYPENATWRLRLVPYRDVVVGRAGRTLVVLMAAVVFVLLIACANVANLLLARATGRTTEMALRKALGATRAQLVRQLLTESVLLSMAGAVLGLATAYALVRVVSTRAAGILPRLAEIHIDATVLAFTVVTALATGILFGMAPAIRVGRERLSPSLATRRATASRGGLRLRNGLVVAQIALSVMLMAGAGLLLRSLQQMQRVEPGFDAEQMLTASVVMQASPDRSRAEEASFWDALVEGMRALPGVESASATTMLPLRGGGDTYYWPEREPPETPADRRNAQVNVVGDDYFETLRIPILAGRTMAGARPSDPAMVVVSSSLAERVFPDGDAIGQRLVVDFGEPTTVEIVGIAGDVNAFGVMYDAPDIFYFAHRQGGGFGLGAFDIVVRTTGDVLALTPGIRAILRDLAPEIPLADVSTMRRVIQNSMGSERFTAGLFTGFAALALLMATVGLYGVLAYIVQQRSREIGIRMALGAARRQVFGDVLGRGLLLLALGIAAGQALAFGAGRLVRSMLFETSASEPLVFALVVPALLVAGLLACALPAWRAMRGNPAIVLRAE